MLRNLRYYWRTNLAVVFGVAIAVAVMIGSQAVGDSVQTSLRTLALSRLGQVDSAVIAALPFTEALGERVAAKGRTTAPVLHFTGIVKSQGSNLSASGVLIYGVDERYWRLQGWPAPGLEGRDALISEPLARELGANAGDGVLLRVEKPSEVPAESLHGRRDAAIQTVRFRVQGTTPHSFSLQPQQGELRVVYVPLATLQAELEQQERANVLLIRGPAVTDTELRDGLRMEDLGLKLRAVPGGTQVESAAGLLRADQVSRIEETAKKLGFTAQPMLTYLANSMKVGDREIPYSLVTAMPDVAEGIHLSPWAAGNLKAKPGDPLTMEFYRWSDAGKLETERTTFTVAPPLDRSGDPAMAPDYPGISDADSVSDWDPPFPLDLNKIRPVDEQYWKQYRTTPKAFVSLAEGQRLWGSRFGKVSGIRLSPAGKEQTWIAGFVPSVELTRDGFTTLPVREHALAAAQGSTDFASYFSMFGGFVTISAFLLTALFFRLGIEQRLREIGLYLAMGYTRADVRRIFLQEGFVLGLLGVILGAAGAWLYATGLLYGLRHWWNDAIGTQAIELHVTPAALRGAVLPVLIFGLIVITITLRRLRRLTPKELLAGSQIDDIPHAADRLRVIAFVVLAVGVLLAGASFSGRIPAEAGFFGAGFCLLAGGALSARPLLERPLPGKLVSLWGLAWANAGQRPTRAMFTIALIGFATFLLISLEAFRHGPANPQAFGRYRYVGETQLPLIEQIPGATMLRVRPGEDASCLNLYAPTRPRIVGLPEGLIPELAQPLAGGAIPAAADANSLQYILHKSVGDEMTLENGVTLRFVATIAGSVFQSEVLISQTDFLRVFPEEPGFRMMLFPNEPQTNLEEQYSDAGLDVLSAGDKLAQFLRVEHAYLSTFQALGGLGLLLGTFGLAAVLLRNVLERRKELALLRAVGYPPGSIARLIVYENVLLLATGLGLGTVCALVAVAPPLLARGQMPAVLPMLGLLGAVFATGLLASVLATRAALRAPLLESLRAE